MNMESTQSRAAQMGRGELLYNEVKSADEIMERVRAVTLEEVRTLAEEFLHFDHLSLSAAGRVKKEKSMKNCFRRRAVDPAGENALRREFRYA